MCITLSGQDGVVEQARRQLEDLVPVWAVLDYTETRTINRELLLVKVSTLGPEYLEDQLAGGPSHDPRGVMDTDVVESALLEDVETGESYHHHNAKMEKEISLAASFEQSGKSTHSPSPPAPSPLHVNPSPPPLTAHQALTLKSTNLQALTTLSSHFGARIVDVSENSVIIELSAKSERVDAFLGLLKGWGILESARTGVMVMPRTPIAGLEDDVPEVDDREGVDASLLPPG